MNNVWKNSSAVLIGFLTVFMLSIGMDMLVEGLGILPPATQPVALTNGTYI
jgi:hypothetical protein